MPDDLRNLWRNQPMDSNAIHLERLVARRAREFDSATRWEIFASIGAALFFAAVIWWRLESGLDHLTQLGLAAMFLWAAASAYRFRMQIRPKRTPPGALAATGAVHYRSVLEHRRDHLKSAWIWHGPLILSCLILLATLLQMTFPNVERLRNMLPFFLLLIVWIFLGWWLRRLKVGDLQRELDELELL